MLICVNYSVWVTDSVYGLQYGRLEIAFAINQIVSILDAVTVGQREFLAGLQVRLPQRV